MISEKKLTLVFEYCDQVLLRDIPVVIKRPGRLYDPYKWLFHPPDSAIRILQNGVKG